VKELTVIVESYRNQRLARPLTRKLDNAPLCIGRAEGNQLRLNDRLRSISRLHCRIERQGDNFVVVDESSNGLYVNANPDPLGRGNRQQLHHNDLLRLGPYRVRVAILDPFPTSSNEDLLDQTCFSPVRPEQLPRVDSPARRRSPPDPAPAPSTPAPTRVPAASSARPAAAPPRSAPPATRLAPKTPPPETSPDPIGTLLGYDEAPPIPAELPAPSPEPPPLPPESDAPTLDEDGVPDLSALLGDLEQPVPPAPPPTRTAGRQDRPTELDELLGEPAPPPHPPGTPPQPSEAPTRLVFAREDLEPPLPREPQGPGGGDSDLLRRLLTGLGLPGQALSEAQQQRLAEALGAAFRVVVAHLLAARVQMPQPLDDPRQPLEEVLLALLLPGNGEAPTAMAGSLDEALARLGEAGASATAPESDDTPTGDDL